MEVIPRIFTVASAPGTPELEAMVTPEVLPFRASSILGVGMFWRSEAFTL